MSDSPKAAPPASSPDDGVGETGKGSIFAAFASPVLASKSPVSAPAQDIFASFGAPPPAKPQPTHGSVADMRGGSVFASFAAPPSSVGAGAAPCSGDGNNFGAFVTSSTTTLLLPPSSSASVSTSSIPPPPSTSAPAPTAAICPTATERLALADADVVAAEAAEEAALGEAWAAEYGPCSDDRGVDYRSAEHRGADGGCGTCEAGALVSLGLGLEAWGVAVEAVAAAGVAAMAELLERSQPLKAGSPARTWLPRE